jgi:hypothetical protein
MLIQQISVFLENKPGRLACVAEALRNSKINIRALTIADTSDFGILRMIVNKPVEALDILKKAGFTVKANTLIAVQIDDREGIFYDIMKLCDESKLNVEYTYSFVDQTSNKAILFLRFENPEKAIDVFIKRGYKLLSNEEVQKI